MNRFVYGSAALWLSILFAAAPASADVDMPQKAFNVEEGVVAVRAGVMPGPSAGQSALAIGKLKYPTRYFVQLVNESPYPLWLDAVWTFPGGKDGKLETSKPIKSSKLPSGGSYWFYSDKLGVIADQPIKVELTAYSDEKRTQRIGGQAAEMSFAQADIDVFLKNFPTAFKNQPKDAPAVVISGWRDLPKPRTDVPGTAADPVLVADIQRTLWKSDSTQRFTCEREIIDAEPLFVDDSLVVSGMGEEALERARGEQLQDLFFVERWRVRSCGVDVTYEVLLSASDRGGTDVMVIDIAKLPVAQLD